MKHVVGVSLGNSDRNKKVSAKFAGEDFIIERIGTDGDLNKAIQTIRELDGKVDAFGLGGADLYIIVRGRRYILKDAKKIVDAAVKTPIVDGSGLKHTLERRVIRWLEESNEITLKGKKVLLVCAMDRFGMADTMVELGCDVIFGDLMFVLGIPIPIKSLDVLEKAAKLICPIVTKIPIKYLYPTRKSESPNTPKYVKYYDWADIIAGDYHIIRKYMPDNLEGKIIITNTVTEKDIQELKDRGVQKLVTTTPKFDGRSFGTNVMEAALVVLSGLRPGEMTSDDYNDILDTMIFQPRVEVLT